MTDEQAARFSCFLDAQKKREGSAIFAICTDSLIPETSRPIIRLQVKAVDWATAKKIVKLLRSAEPASTKLPCEPAPGAMKQPKPNLFLYAP